METEYSIDILVGCRTVIEGGAHSSSGKMSFVAGDILEIETKDDSIFQLGEPVKLTIYTENEVFHMLSTIVAKSQGALLALHPADHQRKFNNRRHFPRVPATGSGMIHAVTRDSCNQNMVGPIPVKVQNISLNGIGFSVLSEHDISVKSQLDLHLDLGFALRCIAVVVRRDAVNGFHYIGARMEAVANEKQGFLRSFILKKQIEQRLSDRSYLQKLRRILK